MAKGPPGIVCGRDNFHFKQATFLYDEVSVEIP
jgi:hypothetical protein